MTPAEIRELVERLKLMAKRSSEAQRMMAASKSLRQAGHEPPRADLYMWSKPEETTEWEAATALTELLARVEGMEALLREVDWQLNGLAEAMRKTGEFDNAADAVQTLLAKVRAALSAGGE